MNHIVDETYKGHELVFLEQVDPEDGVKGGIAVDIRADDFDGEFIHGYCDMIDVNSARLKATGFIDGWESKGK